jgi:protein-arginine kinase activator protein McsA
MTEQQKSLILTLRCRGQSYAAIAERSGCPVNTVKSFCLRQADLLRDLQDKKICRKCGANLTQQTKQKPKTFCCDRCRAAWWTAHRDLLRHKCSHSCVCHRCGREFQALGRAQRTYCSRQCYYTRSVQLAQKQEASP